MENNTSKQNPPLCPSVHSELPDRQIFGVITGVEEPRVNYLKKPVPFTDELMANCGTLIPSEVFRITAKCRANNCLHFDGTNCGVAKRIVEEMSPVVEELPPCPIRRDCQWWQQEGKAACMRCPQVLTVPTKNIKKYLKWRNQKLANQIDREHTNKSIESPSTN